MSTVRIEPQVGFVGYGLPEKSVDLLAYELRQIPTQGVGGFFPSLDVRVVRLQRHQPLRHAYIPTPPYIPRQEKSYIPLNRDFLAETLCARLPKRSQSPHRKIPPARPKHYAAVSKACFAVRLPIAFQFNRPANGTRLAYNPRMDLTQFLSQRNALEFSVDALTVLRGPGVYLYVRDDKAIYVGGSRSAIGRCLARNHHRKQELLIGTSLIIFPCKDHKSAKELEDWLIFELKPLCNERGGWKQLAIRLGVTLRGATEVYTD